MKITTTLPPGGGDHEDHGDVVRVLPAAGVPGRPLMKEGMIGIGESQEELTPRRGILM